MKQRLNTQSTKGFTIIELLIATVVFSVVLLVVSGAIVQFGRSYYKGVVQTRTQDVARNISQDVAQTIQFSRGAPAKSTIAPNQFVLCIGNKRYSYVIGQQVGGLFKHGLVADTPSPCASTSFDLALTSLPVGAREYLGENMQLLKLDVIPTASGLYEVTVSVAYGANSDLNAAKDACNPIIIGGQFCAISTLTTTVTSRLN